ncbi:hypothetical protein D1872_330780 [compost metagenome]
MRETATREYGELLPPDQSVHAVYRAYTGLDEVLRVCSLSRVQWGAVHVSLILSDYWWAIIYRLS